MTLAVIALLAFMAARLPRTFRNDKLRTQTND